VTGTAHSQVYSGRVDHVRSHEAVEATRGVVLGYDGKLVPGYYSSCCGGTAATAIDAIGSSPVNDVPPLAGRTGQDVCIDAKVARWTINRPLGQLTKRFAAWGRYRGHQDVIDLSELAAIDVLRQNSQGRPTRYRVTDVAGQQAELSAQHLRAAANFSGASLKEPRQRLWSSHVSVTIAKDTAGFTGRGFGHGVGMCQYGAETLARDGTNHKDILDWYYPGADIVKAY
jgi:stage II sporulation protein D